ncbi:hypothetical protein MLD38_001221 [Melastoma candidum]|uniref:Uncharacterized protein n=1 Tax=Melastoma candidum TaxID=119954 RepID=A0ACB9SC01_9MYRT|nr:hypothetical protein MLD38_001221 [Melastoma candidum]
MAISASLSTAFSVLSPSSVPQSLNRASNLVRVRREPPARVLTVRGCSSSDNNLRTCKNCKTQFDPLLNHPRACRFHTAHFGGETKRKFESVYSGGTLNTPDSGKVYQYWHCCGSEDPFDPGCTAAPHASYDD